MQTDLFFVSDVSCCCMSLFQGANQVKGEIELNMFSSQLRVHEVLATYSCTRQTLFNTTWQNTAILNSVSMANFLCGFANKITFPFFLTCSQPCQESRLLLGAFREEG